MSIIDDVFTPLYGKPCWSVRSNLGSMLDFEFGDPHLIIREPRTPRPSASKVVRHDLAQRKVKVRGTWHLWIQFCGWRFYNYDKEIGTSISSQRVINRVIKEIDGQSLVKVNVEGDGATAFNFDLGGLFETYPVIEPDDDRDTMDSWTLSEPNGYFFTLRKDIKYCHKLDDWLTKEEDYKLLFPKPA